MSEPSINPDLEAAGGRQEMVNVSELREFVFCERAWYLTRQGLAVSKEAQAR